MEVTRGAFYVLKPTFVMTRGVKSEILLLISQKIGKNEKSP